MGFYKLKFVARTIYLIFIIIVVILHNNIKIRFIYLLIYLFFFLFNVYLIGIERYYLLS